VRWELGHRSFSGGAVRIMGVLNVTPDSFSDGGRYVDRSSAIRHALEMVAEGADLIDVGAESSRPGAEPVPEAVELERVLPVIESVRARCDVPISVDTTKAEVARRALEVGADIVNDITALAGDPEMPAVVAERRAGAVLMHMRGVPRTMQRGDLSSDDIIEDVIAFLGARIEQVVAAGIDPAALCVDPGIGFGKTVEQNLEILARLDAFAGLGRPVLVGVSRKSFLGAVTGRRVEERLAGTLAACAVAVLKGARFLRVHDVAACRDAVRVVRAVEAAGGARSPWG